MKNFSLIFFTIVLISEYVKTENCLPGQSLFLLSAADCRSKIDEGFKDDDAKRNFSKCLPKCIMEGIDHFKNGEFSLEGEFEYIRDNFENKTLGEALINKKKSHIQEASKQTDDCLKAFTFMVLMRKTVRDEPRFNVPYCDEDYVV